MAEGCITTRITTELLISDEDGDGEINVLFNRVASKLGWLEEQINFKDCNSTGKKKTKTYSSRRKKKKETSKENTDPYNLKVESIKKKSKSHATKSKKKIKQKDCVIRGEKSVLTPLNTSKDKLEDDQTDTNPIKISSIGDNNNEPNPITASISNQKYSFLDTDSGGINYLLDQDLDDLYQDSFSPLPNVKINSSAVKSVATHLTFSCSGSSFNDDGAPSPPTVATASLHTSIENISKEQRVDDANSVYASEGQSIDENIFLDSNLSDSDLFDTSVTNDFKESRNEDIESAKKEYITNKSNSPVKEFLEDIKFTDSPDPMNWILSPTSTNKKTNQSIIILDSDSDDDDVKEVQSLKDRLKQNWKQTSVEATKDKKHATKTTYRNCSAVLDSSSDEDDFESFLDSIRTPSKKLSFNQTDTKNDSFINDDSSSSDEDKYFHTRLLQNDKIFKSNKTTKKAFKSFDDDDTDDSVFKTPISVPTPKHIKPKPSISSSSTFKRPTNTSTSTSSLSNYQTNSTPISASFKTPVTKFSSTSFLRSLSTPYKGTSSPSPYVNNFKSTRDELIKRLFTLYNDTVFDNKLPSDFKITWNKRMRKTAGFCYYSQNRGKGERYSRIELSDKVCDSAERLRDTLIHELCHAAAWLIHGVSDGHGKFWKYWAAKANMAHPEIPVISRCHSYVINTKFKYDCSKCGYTIGRHSKSLDTTRYRCGCCKGELVLRPQLDKSGNPVKKRQPSKFALYVKDNYSSVKKDNEQIKHADIMRILSQEFSNKAKISNSS